MTCATYAAKDIELKPAQDICPGEQIVMPRGPATVLRVEYCAPYTHYLAPVPRHWGVHRIATTAGERWAGPGSLVSVYRPEH